MMNYDIMQQRVGDITCTACVSAAHLTTYSVMYVVVICCTGDPSVCRVRHKEEAKQIDAKAK